VGKFHTRLDDSGDVEMETPARKKFKFKHALKIEDSEEDEEDVRQLVSATRNELASIPTSSQRTPSRTPKFLFSTRTPITEPKSKPEKFLFGTSQSAGKMTPKFVIPGRKDGPQEVMDPAGMLMSKEFVIPNTGKDPDVWSPSPRKKMSYFDVLGISNYVQTVVLEQEVNLELKCSGHQLDLSGKAPHIILNVRRWNRFCYYLDILEDDQEKKQILLLDILQKAPKTWVDKTILLGPVYCYTPTPVYREWDLQIE
jgi:hypothetical protein